MERIDRDIFDMMVQDWLADNSPEMDDLRLVGEPYIGEDGRWVQEAEDDDAIYTLSDNAEGDIYISYSGGK